MNRQIGIAILVFTMFGAVGCGQIAEQIEDSTEQTFTLSEMISNETAERQTQLDRVSGQVFVKSGQMLVSNPVTLDQIRESAQAARLGLADVQFSLRSRIQNQSNQKTTVVFGLATPGAETEPVALGSVTLGGGSTFTIARLSDMDQEPDAIRQAFLDAFALVAEDLVVVPVFENLGGANGVLVDYLDIAAEPAALTSAYFNESAVAGAVDAHVYDTKLLGTAINTGQSDATVILAVSIEGDQGLDVLPIAETLLQPGQSIEGMDMLLPGGAESIKTAVKHGMKGDEVAYHFLALGSPDISVRTEQLRFEAKVTVKANLF